MLYLTPTKAIGLHPHARSTYELLLLLIVCWPWCADGESCLASLACSSYVNFGVNCISKLLDANLIIENRLPDLCDAVRLLLTSRLAWSSATLYMICTGPNLPA